MEELRTKVRNENKYEDRNKDTDKSCLVAYVARQEFTDVSEKRTI